MKPVSVLSLILDIDCFAMGDVRGQLLGDQYKGRIWPAVPGRGHGKRDIVWRGRGEGKAAGAYHAANGCNGEESAPRWVDGREHRTFDCHDCALPLSACRSAIRASMVRALI